MEKLLTINNFSLRLNTKSGIKTILEDIMFDIPSGQITALVGPSGSGKSMLAKSVLALFEQVPEIETQGEIILNFGQQAIDVLRADAVNLKKIRSRKIGIIFQQSKETFNPAFTIGFQIREKLLLSKISDAEDIKKRLHKVFSEVELHPAERFLDAYPHQLSGGQIQRALIAMAIVNDPEFLIADEPSSALDHALKAGIMALLKKINQQRKLTILIISHDLNLVATICDEMAIISKGKIVEKASATELITSPKSLSGRALIACVPESGSRQSRLATIQDFENNPSMTASSFRSRHTIDPESGEIRSLQLNENPVLLEVKKLFKSYSESETIFSNSKRKVQVLDDLNFSIKKGEIFGLLGASGSGKSTLARIVAGLEWADEGSVIFNNKILDQLSEDEFLNYRKRCQYIFQDPLSAMAPHMTVGQMLMEALLLSEGRATQEECIESLIKVGLDGSFINKLPRQMSGGERQRVVICRALIFKPLLLICDEVLSALDVSNQAQIINLLLDINKNDKLTILFITHDKPMLEFLCDRTLVLDSLD